MFLQIKQVIRLNFQRLEPTRMMNAMIAAFQSDERPLAELILDLMRVR